MLPGAMATTEKNTIPQKPTIPDLREFPSIWVIPAYEMQNKKYLLFQIVTGHSVGIQF
jgi:hypothetical protein